jgi:hypothetical protein
MLARGSFANLTQIAAKTSSGISERLCLIICLSRFMFCSLEPRFIGTIANIALRKPCAKSDMGHFNEVIKDGKTAINRVV